MEDGAQDESDLADKRQDPEQNAGFLPAEPVGKKSAEECEYRVHDRFYHIESIHIRVRLPVGEHGLRGVPRQRDCAHEKDQNEDQIADLCVVEHETEGFPDPAGRFGCGFRLRLFFLSFFLGFDILDALPQENRSLFQEEVSHHTDRKRTDDRHQEDPAPGGDVCGIIEDTAQDANQRYAQQRDALGDAAVGRPVFLRGDFHDIDDLSFGVKKPYRTEPTMYQT